MDQLSEEVRQESPWTMMFADDIVICSESRKPGEVEVCAGEKRNEVDVTAGSVRQDITDPNAKLDVDMGFINIKHRTENMKQKPRHYIGLYTNED
ncbi:hypothetical protein QTP86_000100 [Hemibagrus guttatus]|nr:hypothetical protein QTP86_000100 [Hemibagrus guttatus]